MDIQSLSFDHITKPKNITKPKYWKSMCASEVEITLEVTNCNFD